MKPRIYHPETLTTGLSVVLTSSAAAHVGKSLRLTENDELQLFNGDGFDYRGRITRVERNKIVVIINERLHRITESPLAITLLQGICRNPRMDILIQKSTELGVNTLLEPKDQRRKRGSCGKPAPGVDLKLLDDDGNEVTEPNVPGELFARSRTVFDDYYKARDRYEEDRRGDYHTVAS